DCSRRFPEPFAASAPVVAVRWLPLVRLLVAQVAALVRARADGARARRQPLSPPGWSVSRHARGAALVLRDGSRWEGADLSRRSPARQLGGLLLRRHEHRHHRRVLALPSGATAGRLGTNAASGRAEKHVSGARPPTSQRFSRAD